MLNVKDYLFRNFTFSLAQVLEVTMLSKHPGRKGPATDGNTVQVKQRGNTKRKETNIRQVSKRQG